MLSLQGPLKIEPIVAQGCRPLADSTWLVDKSENNIIMQVPLHVHPDIDSIVAFMASCTKGLARGRHGLGTGSGGGGGRGT